MHGIPMNFVKLARFSPRCVHALLWGIALACRRFIILRPVMVGPSHICFIILLPCLRMTPVEAYIEVFGRRGCIQNTLASKYDISQALIETFLS